MKSEHFSVPYYFLSSGGHNYHLNAMMYDDVTYAPADTLSERKTPAKEDMICAFGF